MQSIDEQAIRALYQQQMNGWNLGDAHAFAAPFTQDIDFVAFDGTVFTNRDELIAFHDPLFRTHLKGSKLVGEVTSIRFLSPDIAVLRTRGNTLMKGEARPGPARDSIQTLVAVRTGGTWKLTSFQNTRFRPIGRNASGTMLWLLGDWFWNRLKPAA